MTFLLAVFVAVPAFASTATDFYLELLRRGTAEVEAGRHDSAITPLRLAAFGLVDSIEHYQTAQAYLAIAFDRLGQQEEARRAASRIVTAEGIERKFLSLPLPAAIRAAFAAVARKVLSPADAGMLTAATAQTSAAQTPAAPRQNAAPVVPQPQPQSQPQRPPQTTTITVPMPQEPAPQPQTPRNDPPKVVETKPAPQTQRPAQTPPRTDPPKTTTTTTPPVQTPVAPKPQPVQSQPAQAQPQPVRVDVPSRLAAADRALNTANLPEARRIYREVLAVQTLDRATLIRVGEGLYRARDFAPALTAFRRLGALRTGEEAYRYYIAVALYETGDLAAAKRELAAALPFIELTPDVQRYRARIEGAR